MRPIDYFDTAVEMGRGRTALTDGPVTLSYDALQRMSVRIASALLAGSPEGPPKVAFYSPNDYRIVASILGVMRAGGAIVPLHARNSTEVNSGVLRRVGATWVLYHSSLAGEVRRMKAASPVRRWVCLDGAVDDDPSLEALIDRADGEVADWGDVAGNADRPVYYWQTSGTTDEPKIVVDDCGTFDATLRVMRQLRGAAREKHHVSLEVAPLSHAGGCHAFGMLTLGATVIVSAAFEPGAILRTIEQCRVTDMWLPPTALALLLRYPDVGIFDLSSLRRIELGAAAVSPQTLCQAVRVFGPCVSQTYSQIESGVLTYLDPATIAAAASGDHEDRLWSSGRSLFVGRFAVMSEDGRLLPAGETGEIVARGRSVKRYLDERDTTWARRSGWHHTGDLGYMDQEGFLYVVGRTRDVIITGGFKVVAAEVEQAVLELSGVEECAVVGVPDEVRGEAITAVVTVRPGSAVSAQAIAAHCRQRLPRGKVPLSIDLWTELPKSAVGKIDKHAVRAQLMAGSLRPRARAH